MKGDGNGERRSTVQDLNPRRVRVVDGRLQYGMIAVFLTVIVAGLAVFAGLAALAALLLGGEGQGRELVARVLPFLLLNDLCIMVVMIVVGIVATHRIAGPVYRMQQDISRALAGEEGVVVKLRRRDAFGGLATQVNELLERLAKQRAG
jgi:methyl-accepting chemotaxis protein